LKIRIFALAKELGLDSKVLIEHANNAGVKLKNSALAGISPEERDIVVGYIQQQGDSGATTAQVEPRASLAPMRDPAGDVGGKVRAIKTTTPRPQNGREKLAAVAESPDAATSEPGQEAALAAEDSESVDEAADVAQAPDVAASAAEAPAEAGGASAGEKPQKSASMDEGGAPITRDDYVTASGFSGSGVREMKPRGTIPGSESSQTRRSKTKVTPALPNVATPPSYTPKKPKTVRKDEEPAQKPDIPLTAEILEQQSPLKAHLQEKKKKRKKQGVNAPIDIKKVARGKLGAESSEGRQPRRRRRRLPQDDVGSDNRSRPRRRRQKSPVSVALKTSAQIELPITIRGLSEAMGRPAKDLMRILFDRGEMISINENISEETALEMALEMGVDLEIKRARDIEDELISSLEREEPAELLVTRPPVITILGHVDHGKTTMLDKLRSGNVADGEVGGITQHIAAYQVVHHGEKLTFVDTPGHAAFSEMRARGADVTDVVVLVVAADDGVMPQTVECISHAKSAGVPMIVALNKIDLPDTNEQKVLQDLASHDVLPAEWGGDVEVVRTSAETGEGLDTLLDTLLITAELQELTANSKREAVGVCLEAFRDEGRGVLAWFIVQKGTLKIGDLVLCGEAYGRIRALYNDQNQEIQQADPSMPVKVSGLHIVPGAGEHFYVMSDLEEVRETAESRHHRDRTKTLAGRGRPRTLEDILESAREGVVQDLPLIIKADTPGSLEALRGELEKFDHPEVRVQIVHEGVGGVNESDVYLASASGAIVISFHVVPEERARQLAEREGVEIRRYRIIYEITETIKLALEGLLAPERIQVATGRALVLQTFHISRFGTIAGCRVLSGTIGRANRVHVIRDQKILNDYHIASLKRAKDDAREVREGMECGIRLDGFNDIKEGDLLEAFRIEEVKRTLDA